MGTDYRHLSGTGADLSSCDWPPLGKLGLRSGAPDLLRAPACLADELQAARAPYGDWPAPICSLPLKRTELMFLNPSPDAPVHPLTNPPSTFISGSLHLAQLSPSSSSYRSLSICRHLSGPGSYQDLFFSPPPPPKHHHHPPPSLSAAAVIFPHLRLIPGSGGMYGFICTMPTFYWIPIALEQSDHVPNSSRANLIQNS